MSEIATRSEMRLFLTDYHLEAVRMIYAELKMKNEKLRVEEMRGHIEKVARLIEETCDHRRDGELEDLKRLLERNDT